MVEVKNIGLSAHDDVLVNRIGNVVLEEMKNRQLSMKKVSEKAKHISGTQVGRVVNGENYKIKTLLQVLDVLDLEIQIVPKAKKEG